MSLPVIEQNRDGTDVTITLDQKLEGVVGSESQYCIFKVHNELRNVKDKAYEPDIIAIGPFHRSKSHLQTMEEHKLRYLKLLLQRKNERLSTYLDAMKPLEKDARKCYAEPIDLSPDKFVEMMVLDGCFIIELLRKFKMLIDSRRKNDPPEEIRNDPPGEISIDPPPGEIRNDPPEEEIRNDPPEEEIRNDPPEEIRNDPPEEEIRNAPPEEEIRNDPPEEIRNDPPEEEIRNAPPEEEIRNDPPEEEIKNDPPEEEIRNDPPEEIRNDPLEEIRNDPLFRMDWTLNSLQRDLMLFENQLPFVILTKLCEMVKLPGQEFITLALQFFNDLFPGHGKRRKTGVAQDNIKHLLDLIHRNWSSKKLEPNRDGTYNMGNINSMRCSTELAVAGIKFKKIDGKESAFDIQFSNGVLRIPVFTIEDRTESFLRNIMAYEQYCGDTNYNIVTDYMKFFGCLIKSAKDVEILYRNGIVRSLVRDDEVVYRMFSEMHTSIVLPSSNSHYVEIVKRVNEHCERRRNKFMTILRRKYVNSSWGIISIVAASTLLVLASVQALFQVWSWKDSR